jgi:RhtB (resistance to homoserine/threonine) family protein
MPYLTEFIAVAVIHLLAVMSPGPDFAMITRNSLVYSRRTGIFSSIGLGLGILVHVVYSLIGIGLIISQSIVLFNAIKYLGAAYLVYIGYKSLRTKPQTVKEEAVEHIQDMTKLQALRMGFLTNVLNPKATLFFLSLFTQVINPHTPKLIQALYGIEMSVATMAWFSFVALVLSHRSIKSRFKAVQHRAEQAFGVLLVALGIKVALSSTR